MKTRSNATITQSEVAGASTPASKQSASLMLLTLPDDISTEAWITTFAKDGEGSGSESSKQYICCPDTAKILEITEVNTAKDIPRSWLLAPGEDGETKGGFVDRGYITQSPVLYVATPIDPLSLLLPVLIPATSERRNEKNFLTLDDYEDMLIMSSPEWKFVLQHERLRLRILQRLQCMSDKTMAGDEEMYRPSIIKVMEQVLAKARKIVTHELPRSIEQEFVQKVLQIPTTQKNRNLSGDEAATVDKETGSEQNRENENRHPGTIREDTTEHTAKENGSFNDIEELTKLQRLRVAINLVLSYTEPHVREQILSAIENDDAINFKPLDSYLAQARKLRQEATALRALSDNISMKRPATDEMLEAKAEKKRKKEEDEKKKKLQSRGVKNLKNVNTSGMMKLNSFFRKSG